MKKRFKTTADVVKRAFELERNPKRAKELHTLLEEQREIVRKSKDPAGWRKLRIHGMCHIRSDAFVDLEIEIHAPPHIDERKRFARELREWAKQLEAEVSERKREIARLPAGQRKPLIASPSYRR